MTLLGIPWWAALLVAWLACALIMAGLFVRVRASRRYSWVDVAWAYLVGIAGFSFAAAAPGTDARRLLVAVLILLWSFRLGTMLFRRVRRMPEDGRYVKMQQAWGDAAPRNMFVFFQVQALWVVLFALPCLVAAWAPREPLDWLDATGALIAVVAVVGEGIADRQLGRFRTDPLNKGKVCRVGLWRWSRHPNYFFEWVFWWAFVAIGLVGPAGWATLWGPVVMFVFLYRVTGIPFTEAQALSSRGEAYKRYQESTSAFFPWPRSAPR